MILSALPVELWNRIFKIKVGHFRYELSCKRCEFGCLCDPKDAAFCRNQTSLLSTGYCNTCYEAIWECLTCYGVYDPEDTKYACDSCDEDTCFRCAQSRMCTSCTCHLLVCGHCSEEDYICHQCQIS